MTGFEIMKENKKQYAMQVERNKQASGLTKLVGESVTLAWIKGRDWMGGLSDSVACKLYSRIMKLGYTFDEIDDEFNRQMNEIAPTFFK